jgi:hypothetical protein
VVAGLAVAQVLGVALVRMRYPFELEWMEGGVVDHVRVVLAGRPLYREPSLAFTPYIYTPLYYYVSALVSSVVGVGFFAPRLVSTLAMVGNMGMIAKLVRGESGDRLSALVAMGLFAATFRQSGTWMDLARVDSLCTFFVLFAAYLARHGRSWRAAAGTGVLLFLAFFTKQSALGLAAAIVAGATWMAWRRGLLIAAVFGGLTLGTILVMNRMTDGWFGYYVFDVPSHHGLRWYSWRSMLLDPFWRAFPVPLLLALLALRVDVAEAPRGPTVLRAGLAFASFIGGYSSLLHEDGFVNVVIPFYALVAAEAGIGLGWIARSAGPTRAALQQVVLVAVALQFGALAWESRETLPKDADVAAGRHMLERLRARSGEVLLLGSGFYGPMAGHPEIHAHTMALFDVFKTHDPSRTGTLLASLVAEIHSRRFSAITLDQSYGLLPPEIAGAVRQEYRLEEHLFSNPSDTLPKTGFMSRPDELWVPR